MRTPEDLGVPVQSVSGVSVVAGEDARGRPCVYAVMGEGAGNLFVLQINPDTGAFRQFEAPEGAKGARPVLWSTRGKCLFMAASGQEKDPVYNGHLLRFDPRRARVDSVGPVASDRFVFPVSLAEAPDGSLYIGNCPDCSLVRYDPARRKFRQYGRLDHADQYLYVACGQDGTVAALVKMSRPHVVVVDPETGVMTPVGPVADTNRQVGHVALVKGLDGLLYIDSHEGVFRVQGTRLTPVTELPAPAAAPVLPDGRRFRFVDDFAAHRMTYRELEVAKPDGSRKSFRIDWTSEGTEIYLVRPGIDGKVYGSSVLPLHFFSHDPATRKTVDHGACSTASGEIYSMDWLAGKLYFCAYTHAVLGVYDPARPYDFGNGTFHVAPPCRFGRSTDNPRQLGRMDTVAYRPRDMVCGPAGRVWVASVPDYGMWGGTLSWYDPAQDRFGGAHRNIYPDCSPYAITYLPDRNLLAVGFSIYGGSGTEPRAERTGLVLWDPDQDREVWRGDCGLEIVGVMDLEYAGDGLVYAIVHTRPAHVLVAHLLLLDLKGNRVVRHARLDTAAGWPLEVSFQRDGRYLYGATWKSVYRVPLGTTDVEVLWTGRGHTPTCGGALLDGWYYYGAGHRLRRIRV